MKDFATQVEEVTKEITELLIEKNRKYGDSALNPVRITSKSSPVEQILVRIDDKLNRMRNRQDDEDEDVTLDLLGYFILLRIAQKRERTKEEFGLTTIKGYHTGGAIKTDPDAPIYTINIT